jgi:hypothetical protein
LPVRFDKPFLQKESVAAQLSVRGGNNGKESGHSVAESVHVLFLRDCHKRSIQAMLLSRLVLSGFAWEFWRVCFECDVLLIAFVLSI